MPRKKASATSKKKTAASNRQTAKPSKTPPAKNTTSGTSRKPTKSSSTSRSTSSPGSKPAKKKEKRRGKAASAQLSLGVIISRQPEKVWNYTELTSRFLGEEKPTSSQKKRVYRIIEIMIEDNWPLIEVDKFGNPLDSKKSRSRTATRYFKWHRENPLSAHVEELLLEGLNVLDGFCLLVMQELIDSTPHPKVAQSANPMLAKIFSALPKRIQQEAKKHKEVWSFAKLVSMKYLPHFPKIETWQNACLDRKAVILQYEKPGKQPRDHLIAPAGIRIDSRNQSIWLLGAKQDPKTGKWRAVVPWKLDRCHKLVIDTSVTTPSITSLLESSVLDPDLIRILPVGADLLFAHSCNSFYRIGEPLVEVEIRITSPRAIQFVQERKIHPKQIVKLSPDRKTMTVQISKCQVTDILNNILPLTPWFEVIKPEILRDHVRNCASELLRNHN